MGTASRDNSKVKDVDFAFCWKKKENNEMHIMSWTKFLKNFGHAYDFAWPSLDATMSQIYASQTIVTSRFEEKMGWLDKDVQQSTFNVWLAYFEEWSDPRCALPDELLQFHVCISSSHR